MKKRDKIIYWIATLWLGLGMVSTAGVQIMAAKEGAATTSATIKGEVDMITHLGYPMYFLAILGVWKLLGVIAVLIPKFPLLKEWAYAGFFFAMSGAFISHIAMGDPLSEIFPSVLLIVLTVVSWYFRPATRRLISVHQ